MRTSVRRVHHDVVRDTHFTRLEVERTREKPQDERVSVHVVRQGCNRVCASVLVCVSVCVCMLVRVCACECTCV